MFIYRKWLNEIKNYLPLNCDSRIARIVGNITGDGHIQLDNRRGVVSFYSKYFDKIKNENKLFNQLFDLNGHVYKYNRKSGIVYGIMFTSKALAVIFSVLGVPVGNKTSTRFNVPNWILNGDNKIQRAYLLGMFTSEGTIYNSKHNGWRLEIEQYKIEKLSIYGKKYMNQLKKLVENFGIKCSKVRSCRKNKRKDGTLTSAWEFYIWRQSFKDFYDKIGFDDTIKMKKLEKVIQMQGLKKQGLIFPLKPSLV